MKRRFQSTILWRLAAVALIMTCAGIAATPKVLGSGPAMAVTQFVNTAGAPGSTVSALSGALYQAVDQSGKFTAVGGGPLQVKPALAGDVVGPALSAAGKAGAQEVIVAELVSASGGSVVYRLSAYRVGPLYFIRTQVFAQSSLSNAALTAGFVSNLSTLHAPRTAIGTIYSTTNGLQADLGSAAGFHLGQEFNVVRNGQRMGQAHIASITEASATVAISNSVGGYKPQIGDQLVGVDPQPAVPPAPRHPSSFSIWAILAATGAALLAIGHPGQPASVIVGPSPSPTPSGGAFGLTSVSQSGVAPNPETFTFTFSQPVNTGLINFASTAQMSWSSSFPTVIPETPLTDLGGGTPTWTPTNCGAPGGCTLTVTATTLSPGENITFHFHATIQDQAGASLTETNVSFTASAARHPAPHVRNAKPAPARGGVLKPQTPGSNGNDPRGPRDPN